MQINIPTHVIKAAIYCAGTKDIRYYLNGIHIRVTDEQMVYIESTDGVIAFQDRLPHLHETDKGPFGIIIPIDAAKSAAKTKAPILSFESLPSGRYTLGDVLFSAIDGKFPDIDRVMPAKHPVESCHPDAAQFNPEYLVLGMKAMRDATKSPKRFFRLQPSVPGGVGLIHCDNEVYPRVALMGLTSRAFE